MATHKELNIWKEGIELVKQIYTLSKKFPEDEKYGLVAHVRKSAISIPSNIAEGAARKSDTEFIQFLYISLGSLSELETQLIIARELQFFTESEIFNKIESLGKSISSFIRYLKSLTKK